MGIYHIPGVARAGAVVAGFVQSDGSAYITGKLQAATGFQCDASALIGDASGDVVGFGGDAAIASAFQIDVTASDAAVATALSSIVDALQAKGIMGAS